MLKIDFEKLKLILELEKDEEDYPDLTLISTQVFSMIENHLQRTLSIDSYSEAFFASAGSSRMIRLKALPVLTVENVLADDVETTDFEETAYGLRLGINLRVKKLVVNYTGGLSVLPLDLEKAIYTQICYEYQQKHTIGIQTFSTEGGTITKKHNGILPEVERILESYKHPFRVM